MIVSLKDADAQAIFVSEACRRYSGLHKGILRKLTTLHAATVLDDLRNPPGNRLEMMHGGRKGQHSIRINQQYWVCFVWTEGNAYEVEIVDYH